MGFMDFLGSGIVDSIGRVADELITSDEERLEKEIEELKAKLSYKLENKKLSIAYEGELTKRLESDNQGNFLTKSARPVTLYLMLGLIFIMVFGNMVGIVIEDSYIDMVKMLTTTVFSFYFGSKGIEAYKHGRIL